MVADGNKPMMNHHHWIEIRRGLCSRCGKTFTFLPPFSPPYAHYSLMATQPGAAALLRRGLWWEAAVPAVKDPDRGADPSTLRRWLRSPDPSRPPFLFLRPAWKSWGNG
jgi:hypothetical protein